MCTQIHACTRVLTRTHPLNTRVRMQPHVYTYPYPLHTPRVHTDTHLLTITHRHAHVHTPTHTLACAYSRTGSHVLAGHPYTLHTYLQAHTITHIHPPIPPSEIAPLLPTMTSLKKGQGLPDGWDGKAGPPCSFPTPTPIAQGNSDSPAWSGCHAGRGWPPEPPYGRRTSRRHSLLREKGNG